MCQRGILNNTNSRLVELVDISLYVKKDLAFVLYNGICKKKLSFTSKLYTLALRDQYDYEKFCSKRCVNQITAFEGKIDSAKVSNSKFHCDVQSGLNYMNQEICNRVTVLECKIIIKGLCVILPSHIKWDYKFCW